MMDTQAAYYLDDDHADVLIKYVRPFDFFVFWRGDADLRLLPMDSSYMREVFLGEGNNCMMPITEAQAKQYMERLLDPDLHPDVQKNLEALF